MGIIPNYRGSRHHPICWPELRHRFTSVINSSKHSKTMAPWRSSNSDQRDRATFLNSFKQEWSIFWRFIRDSRSFCRTSMAPGATNMSMNFSSFTANKSNPRATTRRSRLHKQAQQGGIMVNEELLNILTWTTLNTACHPVAWREVSKWKKALSLSLREDWEKAIQMKKHEIPAYVVVFMYLEKVTNLILLNKLNQPENKLN